MVYDDTVQNTQAMTLKTSVDNLRKTMINHKPETGRKAEQKPEDNLQFNFQKCAVYRTDWKQ